MNRFCRTCPSFTVAAAVGAFAAAVGAFAAAVGAFAAAVGAFAAAARYSPPTCE